MVRGGIAHQHSKCNENSAIQKYTLNWATRNLTIYLRTQQSYQLLIVQERK